MPPRLLSACQLLPLSFIIRGFFSPTGDKDARIRCLYLWRTSTSDRSAQIGDTCSLLGPSTRGVGEDSRPRIRELWCDICNNFCGERKLWQLLWGTEGLSFWCVYCRELSCCNWGMEQNRSALKGTIMRFVGTQCSKLVYFTVTYGWLGVLVK